METIKMINSTASEVLHLFEVMEKHRATCSLELKLDGEADPFYATSDQKIMAEYLERFNDDRGDAIIVHLGEGEFTFDLGCSFAKYVSDCQIDACIGSDKYIAWFSSGFIPPQGIHEANAYVPMTDCEHDGVPSEQRIREIVREELAKARKEK